MRRQKVKRVVLALLIALAGWGGFRLLFHPVPSFVTEAGIRAEWNWKEYRFRMSCEDQEKLQQVLKKNGYEYGGSIDKADDHGMFGTNIWVKGWDRIEEGDASSQEDQCMAKF